MAGFNINTLLSIIKCLPAGPDGKPVVTEETISSMGFPITDEVRDFVRSYNNKSQDDSSHLEGKEEDLDKKLEEYEQQHMRFVTRFREQQANPETRVKVSRNDPCPCGSGKKYKNCCGQVEL